ncbi:type II toxin-antitoxin system PemK/MazF family toxin [Microbacterium betulae]|uniref:Type II toxin-antitoxin system PemK/MazF family toxin n=1 Tax=Microbacterium betulae TaxID=2981139 RepID=A0AA97FJQ3_9MICO|nr:type II toxin-antitoxin system PemK/MazF family toxin [Microbacterium sp. AB]WOF24533.1 type II toxin-antitoxin system PemK/MazF family toxin [Microbacterium sp. AB]
MAEQGIFRALAGLAADAITKATRRHGGPGRTRPPATGRPQAEAGASGRDDASPGSPGGVPGTQTVEAAPGDVRDLRLAYGPDRDGDPDAGEIVWTWVPYAEGDGRGKDRPVLVIARQSAERVYAVKLTSRPRDGEEDFVSIGTGSWDAQGRESWADLDQLYSVHASGMRREAAELAPDRFSAVARELARRHGWRMTA